MKWLWYAACGIAGGTIGGMGMGGGTVLIPLLSIALGLPQRLAQAINLISFVPMAVIALIIHVKNGLVETKGLWWIVLSGLFFCAAGCLVARWLEAPLLKKFFGGFLIALSVFQACSAAFCGRKDK